MASNKNKQHLLPNQRVSPDKGTGADSLTGLLYDLPQFDRIHITCDRSYRSPK